MKSMLWIRHGQASLGKDNYDQLSTHGEHQSRKLGRHLASTQKAPQLLVHGPLERQRHTASLVRDGIVDAGGEAPALEEHVDLSEYPAFQIFAHAQGQLSDDDEAQRLRALLPDKHNPMLFKYIVKKWVDGGIDVDGTDLLRFVDFKAQVQRAFSHVVGRAQSSTVAAVTSGGPIGMALGIALSLDDHMSMEMAWRISNASTTRFFIEDDGRAYLANFHHHHHLDDDEVTYI